MSGDSMRDMHPLFQVGDGGSSPTSPLHLRVTTIPFLLAKTLNEAWHSRLPRFGTGFIDNQPFLCFGAQFSSRLYAVAIWSNPVARRLPQQTWLELRRLAIAPDAPRHTGSWMLGVMTRLIKRLRPMIKNLISYQDMDAHRGTIYAAAGWVKTVSYNGAEWDVPSRPRPKVQSASPKQRWEKAT
jgi:hypothetical protein